MECTWIGHHLALLVGASLIFLASGTKVHPKSNDTWKLDLSKCGLEKGCWFMPGNCDSASANGQQSSQFFNDTAYDACHSIVTWKVQKSQNGTRLLVVEMEMRTDDMGKEPMGKYGAVGFSYDYIMGDEFVIECVANPSGRIQAYVSFNDGFANLRSYVASKLFISNTHGMVNDGRVGCQTTFALDGFDSSLIPADEKWKVRDISDQQYYLIFARGKADPQSDTLFMHYLNDGDLFPWIATEKTDVTKEVKIVRSTKHYDIPRSIQYWLVKVHGILMVFGWWLFVAVAMFFSRHFKPMWPDRKLCGQAVWFQLHRALMILGVILICAAFALIFIQSGFFITCTYTCDDEAYAEMLHTYLGVACTAAALIQPFMALLRPSPTSRSRPIFNWLHWFVGTGGFVIATITIFLSRNMGKGGLKFHFGHKPDYVMAGYLVAFVVCSIAFEILWYIRFRPQTPDHIPMSTISGPRIPVSAKTSGITQHHSYSGMQTAVLIFFVIAAASLCAYLSYFIVIVEHKH